jgi:hypothetical protein
MLEDAGEEWTEHDPKFYADMVARNWSLHGKPIGDWILTRNGRLKTIRESQKRNHSPHRK